MKLYAPLIASLLLSYGTAHAADPITEQEANQPIPVAQKVDLPTSAATIAGAVGIIAAEASTSDIDFYSFTASAGDDITVDIDGGLGGLKSVDTILTVFDASGKALRTNDDIADGVLDTGSIGYSDARIDHFIPETSGTYYVGVSSWPNYLADGGVVDQIALNTNGASDATNGEVGDYALNITGATTAQSAPVTPSAPAAQETPAASEAPQAAAQQVNIEIKPGSRQHARFNPSANGNIPVALLSSDTFNPKDVDSSSLTFGSTGNESSLSKCTTDNKDVNRDRRADLVCHFAVQATGIVRGDLEATLRGKLKDGSSFEGRGVLKVVPEKRSEFGKSHSAAKK